jgi:hypothetical protein
MGILNRKPDIYKSNCIIGRYTSERISDFSTVWNGQVHDLTLLLRKLSTHWIGRIPEAVDGLVKNL